MLRHAFREYLSGGGGRSHADESSYIAGTELLVGGAFTAL